MELRHLALADRHISKGKAIIIRQECLIAEIDSRGGDTTGARKVLATFRVTQAHHIAHRGLILEELKQQ